MQQKIRHAVLADVEQRNHDARHLAEAIRPILDRRFPGWDKEIWLTVHPRQGVVASQNEEGYIAFCEIVDPLRFSGRIESVGHLHEVVERVEAALLDHLGISVNVLGT